MVITMSIYEATFRSLTGHLLATFKVGDFTVGGYCFLDKESTSYYYDKMAEYAYSLTYNPNNYSNSL